MLFKKIAERNFIDNPDTSEEWKICTRTKIILIVVLMLGFGLVLWLSMEFNPSQHLIQQAFFLRTVVQLCFPNCRCCSLQRYKSCKDNITQGLKGVSYFADSHWSGVIYRALNAAVYRWASLTEMMLLFGRNGNTSATKITKLIVQGSQTTTTYTD